MGGGGSHNHNSVKPFFCLRSFWQFWIKFKKMGKNCKYVLWRPVKKENQFEVLRQFIFLRNGKDFGLVGFEVWRPVNSFFFSLVGFRVGFGPRILFHQHNWICCYSNPSCMWIELQDQEMSEICFLVLVSEKMASCLDRQKKSIFSTWLYQLHVLLHNTYNIFYSWYGCV
jgi:hypothetical protein